MNDGQTPGPPTSGDDCPTAATDEGIVVVQNRDLLFGMRIRNALRSLGYAPRFAPDTEAFVRSVRESDPAPALAVIDMNGPVDWGRIEALVADPAVATPLLAFGPHVDVAGRRAAKAAGVTRIVSNGDFHRDTVGLIRRYVRGAAAGPPADRGDR